MSEQTEHLIKSMEDRHVELNDPQPERHRDLQTIIEASRPLWGIIQQIEEVRATKAKDDHDAIVTSSNRLADIVRSYEFYHGGGASKLARPYDDEEEYDPLAFMPINYPEHMTVAIMDALGAREDGDD